jgi:hypothetical protein
LEFFARLEADGFAWGYICDFACSGVAAHAALTGLHDKNAEAAQLYALAALQGILHCFKQSLDCDFSFDFRDASFIGDLIYYVELDHVSLRLLFCMNN